MGRDSQVPQDESENRSSTALSKQPKTSQDVVLDWLRLYAAMPYMRGEHEITAEVILFYTDSLGPLEHPVALHRAWQWCRDHRDFLPQPKEIHEAYQHELGKIRVEENQLRERIELCGDCRGTGHRMVDRPDAPGYQWAVACDCRKKKTA